MTIDLRLVQSLKVNAIPLVGWAFLQPGKAVHRLVTAHVTQEFQMFFLFRQLDVANIFGNAAGVGVARPVLAVMGVALAYCLVR